MSAQIDQIFTAKAENIWQFLQSAGQGCYVPAYQRPYAWDDENVDRLIDDAINGLNHLEERSTAISFLGTIIAIHDINNVTVKPVYKAEVTNRVMTLIDGQQRISTAVMMNVALHHHITALQKKLTKVTGDQFDWIQQQSQRAIAELWNTFSLDQTTGTPEVYRYYPRIIRAFDDVWSTKGNQAQYRSPIARLVWQYIVHVSENKTDVFNYKVVGENGEADTRHAPIVEVFRYMRQQLNYLTSRKSDQYAFPNLQKVVRDDKFMSALWGFSPSEPVVKYITEQSDDKFYEVYASLLKSLIFHKYFNMRMALTIVTTKSEDDAFDMFEALNTTGEPLTAFETFKPKIIEAEGLERYENSPVYKDVSRIENYLEAFKKADDRQKATSELLIPFRLSETGERLEKNLGEQRRFLRDYYDTLASIEDKRDVVASLANLAAFIKTGWASQGEVLSIEQVGKLDAETGFCFQSLRALKHVVVVGALFRFYDEFRRADDATRIQRKSDLFEAIRAVTAFSMLWRGGLGGTDNIDAIYRGLMRDGLESDKILPIAKRPKGQLGAVSVHSLKRILWSKLTQEFPERTDWVKAAARVPIYRHSSVVAKFLVIVASDDAAIDGPNPGLILRGKKGLAATVQEDAWGADNHFSVEHIAPQAKSPGWEESLYEDPQLVDRLGNLTLLPSAANGYVSNRSWKHKVLLYRYFCSETQAGADALYATFRSQGLAVNASGEAVLGQATYMPMCKAIGAYQSDWGVEIVAQRSTRLAELAYDRVIGWLKPNDVAEAINPIPETHL